MTYPTHLLPTTVVGSYPQPDWLVNRAALEKHGVPRTHAHEIWRIPRAAARAGAGRRHHSGDPRHGARGHRHHHRRRDPPRKLLQPVRAGAGRHRRRASRRGAVADRARHAGAARRRQDPPPRRRSNCAMSSSCCARPIARRRSRCPVRSPCRSRRRTSSIEDEEEMAMDYAAAVNEELRDLKATGVDVVQLDEPWVRTAPDKAERYGVRAINRALEGIAGTDRGASLLRLCARRAQQAEWLRVPVAACRHDRAADLDRGGRAEDRSRRAGRSVRQADHAWRARPRQRRGGDRRAGRRAHPSRPAACRLRNG